MPTKHSRNATGAPFYSYHERKKLKDVGTKREMLDTNALRRFEACWLCNRTAVSPVCTPEGLLFCKKCLFLNFEQQKEKRKEEMIRWTAAHRKKERDEAMKQLLEETTEQRKFLEEDQQIISYTAKRQRSSGTGGASDEKKKETLNMTEDKAEARKKSFWAVENTPSAAATADDTTLLDEIAPIKKPLQCPITNKPLKLKQLVYLKPETADDQDSEFARWLCAVSKRPITTQKAAAVIFSGDIILQDCLDKYVLDKKSGGFYEGKVVTRDDIIPLVPGGTGYSAHNNVVGLVHRACIQ